MAFFPDVAPGDTFRPSALLENNLRHIVNAQNGFGAGALAGGGGCSVRIQIYNATSETIAAGSGVNFDGSGRMIGDAVPAKPCSDASKPWGVTTQRLKAYEMGDCVVSGPVKVGVALPAGKFVVPGTPDPSKFIESESGATVLYERSGADGTESVILLGGTGGAAKDEVFLCKIKGGNSSSGYIFDVVGGDSIIYDSDLSSNYVRLFVPEMSADCELPKGTCVLGHRCMIKHTGGSDS